MGQVRMGQVELIEGPPAFLHRALGRVGVRIVEQGWMSDADRRRELESLLRDRAADLGAEAVVEVRYRRRRRLRSATYSLSGEAVVRATAG